MLARDLIASSIRANAGKTATICGDRTFTFDEVNARANSVIGALHGLGMQKGDRFAVLATNCAEYRELPVVAAKSGLALVPLNFRLTTRELAYIIDDAAPSTLIVGKGFSEIAAALRPRIARVSNFISLEGGVEGMLDYEGLIQRYPVHEPEVELEDGDLLWILYTSGTTGHPKGAMLTQRNLAASLAVVIPLLTEGRADSVNLTVLPMHAAAGGLYDHGYLIAGCTSVILDRFEPERYLQAIETYGVTNTQVVPTIVSLLLESPAVKRHSLTSLRTVLYTGAPMPVELTRRAMDVFGNVFAQCYGTTETVGVAFLGKEDHLAALDSGGTERLASCGKPLPGVEVRVVGEGDVDQPAGEPGEILVRSAAVMPGYWNLPEPTAEALAGGWYHTGDMAVRDDDGYLYILDRKQDMIISGGLNIYPREVEEAILAHPAVQEAAVVGVADPLWGEAVRAFVVLKEGMTATDAEIIEHCKARLASYKKPRSVVFMSELPKNATGKVLRRKLRPRQEDTPWSRA